MEIKIFSPESPSGPLSRLLTNAFVPYEGFIVDLRATTQVETDPLTVQITETPYPRVGVSGFKLGGSAILVLDQKTRIIAPNSPLHIYFVDRLSDFDMKSDYIRFRNID